MKCLWWFRLSVSVCVFMRVGLENGRFEHFELISERNFEARKFLLKERMVRIRAFKRNLKRAFNYSIHHATDSLTTRIHKLHVTFQTPTDKSLGFERAPLWFLESVGKIISRCSHLYWWKSDKNAILKMSRRLVLASFSPTSLDVHTNQNVNQIQCTFLS